MAFPSAGYSLGGSEAEKHATRSTCAAVAHAIAEFEPVTMLVDPGERQEFQRNLSADLEVVEAPLNDAWMCDIGSPPLCIKLTAQWPRWTGCSTVGVARTGPQWDRGRRPVAARVHRIRTTTFPFALRFSSDAMASPACSSG